MQYLTIWDVILTPIYLIVLILIAKRARDKSYPEGHPLRLYYLPGLLVKFAGAVFIALVYQFYYGGGDTYEYFTHARIINSSLDDSFTLWLKLIFHVSYDQDPYLYKYASQMTWYNDSASYTVCVIAAVAGLLNGTTYLPIALLFAYISFTGIWAMYRTFASLYPNIRRQLAFAFLFIPSTFVWGSAIFKDTVCMFGLGWMTYTTFRIFVNKDYSYRNLFMLAISFYLIGVIKIYILMAFLPALTMWLLLTYSHRIKSSAARAVVGLLFVGIIVSGFILATSRFAKELNRYSLDRIAATSAETRDWIAYSSGDEGSSYDLGEFSPTPLGMLSKFPASVIVTLFRPFMWEAKKIIVLFSALEALVFTYLTILVFARNKGQTFRKITSDPTLLFCLIFTLIFAFAVGISSYNFGALSRYKIPCLPFYGAFVVILIFRDRQENVVKSLVKPRKKKVFQIEQ